MVLVINIHFVSKKQLLNPGSDGNDFEKCS